MKIKDVSLLTGLTKKTIRFYEAQGLLSPEKTTQNGREYRTYSEADILQLEKIAALRKARLTVEEIRRIQETPAETPAVFSVYRQRLQNEARELASVLAVANTISPEELTSAEALILRMESATAAMPLPAADIHPHFHYIDDLEAILNMKQRKQKLTAQEAKAKKIAATGAAAYAATSVQNSVGNNMAAGGRGFDISNAQKIAAYNLLMNTKDD